MNIYVETNFVLEITFEQEQCASCEQILSWCEEGKAKLMIPAYSLAEPHEKLIRQSSLRRDLQRSLDAELRQLSRTSSYGSRIQSIQDIASLIVKSNEEERFRFIQCRERLLKAGEVIALTAEVLTEAALFEDAYSLAPQDAIVYASIISHLRCDRPSEACFLNRNFKDFDIPNIVDELNQFNCRLIRRFDSGCSFLQSQQPPE
jgi:predicted nucleic acid-binding protein